MPLNADDLEAKFAFWSPTCTLRWFRPKGYSDNEIRLEQLWERTNGERQWRPIHTVLED